MLQIVMSGSTSLPSKGPASLGKGATVPKIKDKGNQKGSQADHGQSSKSKRKTKGSSDVDHESKRGQKKAKRGSRKDDKSRKRTIEVEEDDDDENSDGSSEDEPTKRKAKRSKAGVRFSTATAQTPTDVLYVELCSDFVSFLHLQITYPLFYKSLFLARCHWTSSCKWIDSTWFVPRLCMNILLLHSRFMGNIDV